MKTPAEFEPIALWMGWEKYKRQIRPFCVEEYWRKPTGEDVGPVAFKTSLTDAEAVEALNRLTDETRSPFYEARLISNCGSGWYLRIVDPVTQKTVVYEQPQPTTSAAVEEALLGLIAAEGVQ